MKTPISYYGGKQAMISHILPLIPEHDVYTEVFFGGGTVFFAKKPVRNETINDKLDIVINFYQQLKNNFPELQKKINDTPYSRTFWKHALKTLRMNGKADPVEKAWAAFYTLNMGFANKRSSGMGYSNHQGTSCPDKWKNKKIRFSMDLQKRIDHAFIENDDALKILRSRNVAKSFHYIDPPYFNADQGHYKGYTETDFVDLLNFLQNECKGKFLLSNYNSPVLGEYIQRNGWHKKEIRIRLQAPKIRNRDKVEVLVWNYKLSQTKLEL